MNHSESPSPEGKEAVAPAPALPLESPQNHSDNVEHISPAPRPPEHPQNRESTKPGETPQPPSESAGTAPAGTASGIHPPVPKPSRRKTPKRRRGKVPKDKPLSITEWLSPSPSGVSTSLKVGGEGGQSQPQAVALTNPPYKLKTMSKGFSVNGLEMVDISELPAKMYNSLVELIDRRIRAYEASKEVGKPVALEEQAVRYEAVSEPVVWRSDPEGTVEMQVTGKPLNERMRMGTIEGMEGVQNVWVSAGMLPMIGKQVACKPSDDPDRPGYIIVGVYGRKGGRIA